MGLLYFLLSLFTELLGLKIMEKGKRHISLKDLAQEIGVSISTVSRALNNHPDISPEVTRKIQKLAAEMNYTPNPLAMGLLKQATRTIGVIVPDLVTHFYSPIISGIEQVAEEKGYFILIASSNETLEKEIKAVDNLMKTRVEGLIVCLSCLQCCLLCYRCGALCSFCSLLSGVNNLLRVLRSCILRLVVCYGN